ncbi:hypothetical protein KUCAC02_037084, partial [Chaenocephalus aceratus]
TTSSLKAAGKRRVEVGFCSAASEELLFTVSDADGSEGGFQLKKEHALRVLGYISSWTQRQCLCCFKEYKHLEVFNQLVYALINLVIAQISSLRDRLCCVQDQTHKGGLCGAEGGSEWSEAAPGPLPQPSSPGEDEPVNVERDSAEEDAETSDQNQNKIQGQGPSPPMAVVLGELMELVEELEEELEEELMEELMEELVEEPVEELMEELMEELEAAAAALLEHRGEGETAAVCRQDLPNPVPPSTPPYKHNTHPTIEDISAHESNILGSFCDMNDVEVPLHLLRYVCLFCGKHGLSLMKESLPFPIAHAFITIVSNIRIWLHIPAVMQHIIPFRTYVIRYLCKLSDQELRQSAARKHGRPDESLDLAFKYFMSPTLTMRLAGLSQITNQLHTFNDVCNNESLVSDTETSIAKELADWLIHNNVVEHIFGPNLHIEIIKQCQVILNFLAAEGRLSTQHVDCIWAAAQLKHCSRYIHDLFPSLIKNLDPVPLRHVLNLVSGLHPSAHTEQTLYLASMLIKALWNNALAAKAQLSKQSSFASLLNTNLPMGNKKGSPAASPDSSDNSDTQHSGGSDMEMDDQMMSGSKRGQQRLSDTEESMQAALTRRPTSQPIGREPRSEMHSDDMADSGNHQKEQREQTESRKRKAGEALGEGTSQGAGPSGSGGGAKSKNLPFNPEASSAAVMASASLEGRMRMLDACSASASARPDVTEPQQPEIGPSQMVQGPQGSQEPPCLPRGPGDFLGDAMGNEIFNCRRFI